MKIHMQEPSTFEGRIFWKTAIVSTAVIAANVVGNYALRRGLLNNGSLGGWSPGPYIHAFVHPWVAVGVVFMLAWLITRLALLSWADLSYVLPVTAFAYALTALVGAIFLNEKVTRIEWAGITLITLGVAVTAITFPETTPAGGARK